MRLDDLTYLSTHEAGHLVAAHVLGLDPAGAMIALDGRMAGMTVVDPQAGSSFDQAVVALAGLAATRIAGDTSQHFLREQGDDIEHAEGYLRDLSPERRKEVGPMVFELLKRHRPLVLAVSAALAATGSVDREELSRLAGEPETAAEAPTGAGYAILARTELPPSVYRHEVEADAPAFWWRLDENLEEGQQERVALNSGSVGTAGNGTYVGSVNPGAPRIVVHDPGTSLETFADTARSGMPPSGVSFPSAQINLLERFNDRLAFTVEGWCRPQEDALGSYTIFQRATTPATSIFYLFWFTVDPSNAGQFTLNVGSESINSGNGSAPPGFIYHWVARFTPSGSNMAVSLWLNGTQVATGTFTGTPNEGTIDSSALGQDSGGDANNNWTGLMSNVAIYLTALSDARIQAHYAAGTSPWQGDSPDDRLGRILDLAEWPSDLREINAGSTTFQSAETAGQTALEHAQKVGETEAGLFFADRAGNVVLRDQAWQTTRTPYPIVFGDGAGQIGFRSIRFDDGDEVLRNSATISRYNGVAKTDTDTASVSEFGRFQYTLEGLLHDSDAWSTDYAAWIVDEYAAPRRRITEITVGPPKDGEEDLYLPAMLGLELGDLIDVSFTPSGLGDAVEQRCVIEGIRHSSAPGRNRTVTFALSPEFGTALFG